MSMKSLIAVATGDAGDERALTIAGQLAAAFAAHVSVILAFPDPAAALVAYGAALGQETEFAAERIAAAERQQQGRIEAMVGAVAARHGLAVTRAGVGASIAAEPRGLQPAATLARATVLADLAIFDYATVRGPFGGLFAETLLNGRVPTLIAKRDGFGFGPAAIAWDGSGQAGRAVRAALPLLLRAPAVHILRNADDAGPAPEAGDPGRLRDYLQLNGVAEVTAREVRGEPVAATLLAAANAVAAELLVAGGYGRPRLFELALGGATRDFVSAPGGPNLLLAH